MTSEKLVVAIATPLSSDNVARIAAAHPNITIRYEPDLLPPERFPADHSGDPSFQRTEAQETRYWEMLRGANVLYGFPNENVPGLAKIASSPNLAWIQAMAAGAGGAVKAANLSQEDLARLTITTSSGVHALPLAEFAIMGALNGLKRTAELAQDQANKHWPTVRTPTRLAAKSNVVITGLGEIGLETARLARALNMNVSGTKRNLAPIAGIDRVASTDDLLELVANADVVINTLPGTEFTENMFNSEVFDAMKPGTILVNVGRGTVIDEDALLVALNSGQVGYACLDVFATEPLPATSPLWEHPRVMVSPHTSALSVAENDLITDLFIQNLTLFQAGKPLPHTIDPVHFY